MSLFCHISENISLGKNEKKIDPESE